jgi:hypothetical protein
MEVIVNESTSVIRIDGSVLALPIVYISSCQTDHFATVMDTTGYVTSTNALHLSTTGATLTGGATDVYIKQPFGYISLAAVSTNTWAIVNQDPFSVNASTIRALDSFTNHTSTLLTGIISTMDVSSDHLTLTSVVSQTGSIGNRYITSKSLNVSSDLRAGGLQASTVQSASATLSTIRAVTANVAGDVATESISTQNIFVTSVLGDQMHVSNLSTSADTDRALNLLSIVARSTTASTLSASNLYLGSTSIVGPPYVTNTIQTPLTSVNVINAFATYVSSISAVSIYGTMSNIEMGSAAIINPLGSMSLSSLTVGPVSANNVSGQNTSTSLVTLSSITMNTGNPQPITFIQAAGGPLTINSAWSISTNALYTQSMNMSTLSVRNATTQSLTGDTVMATTLAPNMFRVESTLALSGSRFNVSNADIIVSEVSSSVQAESLIVRDISGLQRIVSNTLSVPRLITSDISANTVFTQTVSTPIIYARNLTVGQQLRPRPSDPYISVTALTSFDTSPYQYASGTGTFNNPFITFNTAPTVLYISLYNPLGQPLYLNVKIRHTNLPAPNAGIDGGASVYINGSLVFNVLNRNEEPLIVSNQLDLNIANYPIQVENPATGDSTPYLVWEVQPSSVTTDQLIFWVSNNLNSVDSNTPSDLSGGITMRKGIIEWPSTIYGTSIANPYNDIQTRSLFYTGSLNSVSDPALKRDLGEADLDSCVAAAQIPLHTYEYKLAFASTFQTKDVRRLGILTTELSTFFPKSVTTEYVMDTETQVASTDQLRYAHLGATKFLIAEVQRLRQKLLDS